jgi:hypothetical protein
MKKTRKLVLHRETLHSLELRGVAGGGPGTWGLNCTQQGGSDWCNEGTYGDCGNSLENCSAENYCETGGACSTSDSC